ncbi:DUF2339 domain-containing protein [uncultured Tateyamaria sp.]|uniref:DUF2339 domain-containing protein n=1 Tax=uncultured Tateyamaria sp. TaxID=455651 RepID=UPI0026363CD8|nr:DUF2339 domain-containing protein [uncultured Tateyamaria sp.]
MEAMLVLLGSVVLAIPVAVIYLLVTSSGLNRRITELEAQVARLMAGTASPAKATAAASPEPKAEAGPEPAKAPEPENSDAAPESEVAAARVIAARRARTEAIVATQAAEPRGPSPVSKLATWLVANWFYAVSALSLALAGLFLVQYGVENGLLPPTARVLAALVFGGALIAGGEVIRRRFGDSPDATTAYLPSVFSGAGLVTLFGGVAAARLLYELIGVEMAFVGLASVGLLGVVLGWLHGPLLAAVGVIGAFTAPMLVGSTAPATPWLFVYFGVVTAVGLTIDTVRRWAWVSALSVALGFGMGWLTVQAPGLDMTLGFQLYVTGLAALAILIPARGLTPDHDGPLLTGWLINVAGPRPWFPTFLAGAVVAVTSSGLGWTSVMGPEAFWFAVCALGLIAGVLTVWSVKAQALQDVCVLPIAALIAVIALEGIEQGSVYDTFASTYAETTEERFPLTVTLLWGLGLGLSLLAAARSTREGFHVLWAIAAALMAPAVAVVIEMTWQPAAYIGAYPWALHAITMGAIMVALAVRFGRRDGVDKTRASLFVLSALASITFALVLIFSMAALTVAVAVTVAVAAALDRRFDLPLMQLFVTVGVVAVGVRLVGVPGLVWALEAPVWEIVLAYGGALAAFCASLWMLRDKLRITAQLMLDTGAWATGGMLASLLLFRGLENALGQDGTFSHWGFGLYAVIWLSLMMVQLIRAERLGGLLSWMRRVMAVLFGIIGFVAVLAAVTLMSPLLSDWLSKVSGPPLINTLLVAYLLPALVLTAGAVRLQNLWLKRVFGALAVTLAIYWAFAALRHVWQGSGGMILDRGFSQPELYSYTVAILVTGAALFYQSLARRSTPLRRAGLVVIGLAVAKVFLIDISGLEGLTRVLSLVVLGLSLAALAWLNRWAQSRYESA